MKRREFIKQVGTVGATFYIAPSLATPLVSTNKRTNEELPFIFGAQYYRAPTPEPECWEDDFIKMSHMGFNAVKFWVQWRWSHRSKDDFFFDDLKTLMNLAARYKLNVTLNVIFDVSPVWLYKAYPEAQQITASGKEVKPFVYPSRQIGGHSGPCYNHPEARLEREKFLATTVMTFKNHEAMHMWDVWNEPEIGNIQRKNSFDDFQVCYCKSCQEKFTIWLKSKYHSISELNKVWGRCYLEWSEVEMPVSTSVFVDFLDWRSFHVDTITEEANWRLKLVKKLDPMKTSYLHVVPNKASSWNTVTTAVDDYELAKNCDVFAATINAEPENTYEIISAARGKVCYNVESHINFGATTLHQRMLSDKHLQENFLPQIGLGIKGFMFWQFRPEVLGREAPAWGLTNLDGSDRPITKAAKHFWDTIGPHASELMKVNPANPNIAIWKSKRNEMFHFCLDNRLTDYREGLNNYVQALYWNNYHFRFVTSDDLIQHHLKEIKLLIMPNPYCLSVSEAKGLEQWVRNGGTLLSEVHLGAYNDTTGRHSRRVPGCGLSEAFGIKETDTSSSWFLKLEDSGFFDGDATSDTAKSLKEFGNEGGKYIPIKLSNDKILWGSTRYAHIHAHNGIELGSFDGEQPTVISKKHGKGYIVYCGSSIGLGANRDKTGFYQLIEHAVSKAQVQRTGNCATTLNNLHIDLLEENKVVRYLVIWNNSDQDQDLKIKTCGTFKGLFSGNLIDTASSIRIRGGSVDIYQKTK